MEGRVQMLREALTVLASDARSQLNYLDKTGAPMCIDELAFDFDAIAMATGDMLLKGETTEPVRKCAMELLSYLKSFSGEVNAHLWTPEALRSAAEWEKVRRMATECLAQLK